ncbi:MAG TPA: hypothetical protein VFI91_11965 [Longimicrobiaceae bacterium]|nr:hypothetical protein [Longimicrobiaceae bacterium]
MSDIRTMNQILSVSLADGPFRMLLLAGFAGVALLLGMVGIYGVISYAVSQRSHEIAIRMATGSHRSSSPGGRLAYFVPRKIASTS